MHDGVCSHRPKVAKYFLDVNNIELLELPDNSPNSNPFENLWIKMKIKVSKGQPLSQTELGKVIKEVWLEENFKKHCQSLMKRM